MEELEIDRHNAISDEDFHRALDLQQEMKSLRGNVLASVEPSLAKDVVLVTLFFNIEGNTPDINIHRPKNLFEKSDFKISSPKLFTPIDLSPTDDFSVLNALQRPPKKSTLGRESPGANSLSSAPSLLKRSNSASTVGGYSKQPPASPVKRPASASSKVSISSHGSGTNRRTLPSSDRWHSDKFLEKENTVVPALRERRRRESQITDESQHETVPDHVISSIPLMERGIFSRGSDLFGSKTMEKLYSKKWQERRDGLTDIQDLLQTEPSSQSQATDYCECVISILQRHLKDPLYNVYTRALDLMSFVCTQYIPQHSLHKMAPSMAKSTANIISLRASDTDRRSAGITLSTINDIMEEDNKIAKAFLIRFLKMGAPGGQRGQAAVIQNAVESLGAPNAEV
ncbi:hypothetical protein OESDEN_01568 [Oesophagostomum dentatum]|uniref:TOG domain-containing protein n=1 Tax=Oesophagostomum dentatum TaxID=61180 RepID=A0A0B1TSQ5_OESDE|nr:hypothetical protein OESDEN_01568 [Oesophagostomum dentatum]